MKLYGYAGRVSGSEGTVDRPSLERLIAADLRTLTAESEQVGQVFAGQHRLSANDFRALLHVMVAETAGAALTAGELRQRMGMSGAAITYLVERMIDSGHICRDSDAADRRKVILRYADHGMTVAQSFFGPLGEYVRRELADLTDADLEASHRTFTALTAAMRAFRADLRAEPGESSGRLDGR